MKSEARTTIAFDPVYRHAVEIVQSTGKTGIAHLQARLFIGYNRAARLLEAMEEDGILGPHKADGTRDLLQFHANSIASGMGAHTGRVAVITVLAAISDQLLESATPYDQACTKINAAVSAGSAVDAHLITDILSLLDQSAKPFDLARENLRVLLQVVSETDDGSRPGATS